MWYFIKKAITYIILISVIAFFSFYIYDNRPCNKPITYKIGNIDSGFNISTEEFLKDIQKAAELWNTAHGKDLFKYDKNGKLTISLIYDDRQKNVDLRSGIDKKNDVAQSVKDEYERLVKDVESRRDQYNSNVKQFNSQVNGYSRKEYDEKKAELENQRSELNRLSEEINQYISKYNLLIRDINVDVNIANQSAGEIEQGLYTSKDNSIKIYEYESRTNLIRVTAHELGHALGIDHNDNPNSIMYKLNEEDNLSLSAEDTASLRDICRINII